MEHLIGEAVGFITGESGGIFAFGLLAGWTLCSQTVVKDLKGRVESIERELKEVRASMQEQINRLQAKYEEELRVPSLAIEQLRSGNQDYTK